MKSLKFEIDIAAEPKKVWDKMLQRETYNQWTRNAWPDSTYTGEFKQGNEVRFHGPDGSGTLAKITSLKPYDSVTATHIAILNPGGERDTTSDAAKDWIGIEEKYQFTGQGNKTHVTVEMSKIAPSWEKMFADSWPTALKDLKELVEN